MTDDKSIGITKVRVGAIAPRVIVVGDPARAKVASEMKKTVN